MNRQVLVAAVSILLVLSIAPVGSATGPGGVSLEQVWELRRAGDFAQALEAARSYRRLLEDTTPVDEETRKASDRLINTLEAILALPAAGREAVARADVLRQEILEGFRRRQYDEALANATTEVDLRRAWQSEDKVDLARSLYIRARLQMETGDRSGAEASFREAVRLQREVYGDIHPATGRSLHYLADLRTAAEDYAEARTLLLEVVAIYTQIYGRSSSRTYDALDYLASVTDLLGDEREAVELREECVSLVVADTGPDSPETAAILRRLALSYEKLGRLDESVETYERSLAILRRCNQDDTAGYANGLTGLAVALQRQGELERSEILHREALVLARKVFGPRDAKVARFLGNLAFSMELQGRYARAGELYGEALAIQRESLPEANLDLALTLDNLAALEKRLEHMDVAETLFAESLRIRREILGEKHADVARSLNHLAEVHLELGRPTEAESEWAESLAIRREIYGNDHPMIAVVLANLAKLERRQKHWARADSLGTRCLAMRRAWLGAEHPNVGQDLMDLAEVRVAQGRLDKAADLLTESAGIYEKARLRAGTGWTRATAQIANPYPALATVALLRGDSTAAWGAVEHSRARALADLISANRRRILTARESAVEDSMRRALLDCEQRLLASRNLGTEAAKLSRRLQYELEAAESAWSAYTRSIDERYPAMAGEPVDVDKVRNMLRPREAMIGWLDADWIPGGASHWVYLLTRDRSVQWFPLSDTAGCDTTSRIRQLLGRPDADRREIESLARAIWSERFSPLAPHLADIQCLIIIPGDAMAGIPVEVLTDGQGRLAGDRWTISYAPSATVWHDLRSRPERSSPLVRALLVANPSGRPGTDPEAAVDSLRGWRQAKPTLDVTGFATTLSDSALRKLPRLEASGEEVRAIAEMIPGAEILTGSEASEQNLHDLQASGALAGYDLIHFATHAIVDEQRPALSALVLARDSVDDPVARALAKGRVYDGLLSAGEIIAEWNLEARMVVLSACRTGLGRKVAGEGYLGFTNAFLQVGADAVVVSLWSVDDRGTRLIMTRFYENMLGTTGEDRGRGPGVALTPAEALTEAKRYLRNLRFHGRKAFSHPFFWSAFVLVSG